MQFLLKTSKTDTAQEIDDATGRQVMQRLRHEGRRLVEVFVLTADGTIDRFQERTRRRLGSNAVASRTWLCETHDTGGWINGRYIPEPVDAIDAQAPPPFAVLLVLAGAEGDTETCVNQLSALSAAR